MSGQPRQPEGALVCARCAHVLTYAWCRIDIDGRHRHTCVNPSSLVFVVLCFARAPGATPVGPAIAEHSWFPGHAWQVAACAACGAHVGWLYSAGGAIAFAGLIEDALQRG